MGKTVRKMFNNSTKTNLLIKEKKDNTEIFVLQIWSHILDQK